MLTSFLISSFEILLAFASAISLLNVMRGAKISGVSERTTALQESLLFLELTSLSAS